MKQMIIEVAVPTPLSQTFTYLVSNEDEKVSPGMRVLVPFGNRKMVGVVLGPAIPYSKENAISGVVLKPIHEMIDKQPIFTKSMLDLARWMSSYYMHPIGEVLKTMLPGGVKKSRKRFYQLSDDFMKTCLDPEYHDTEAAIIKTLFGKKSVLSERTFERKWETLKCKKPYLKKIELKDFLRSNHILEMNENVAKSRNIKLNVDEFDSSRLRLAEKSQEIIQHEMTEEQKNAFSIIFENGFQSILSDDSAKNQIFSSPPPFLLFGVTGSGKTEIYLQLISKMLSIDPTAQALILVPEIALTPQMTRIFEVRFIGKTAVVHSAMSDVQRWAELERIRSSEAAVLIGPRSAIFGPFRNLKLIVVDEEHDTSYKQETGLTYNARDVAVLRGNLEQACVVLGSATPSMESFQNALSGKYRLLNLRERVSGRPLPVVEPVSSKPSFASGVFIPRLANVMTSQHEDKSSFATLSVSIPIAPEIIEALKENARKGHQSMVLVNRRGYSFYLLSVEDKKVLSCPRCSISLTLHKKDLKSAISNARLCCHYCAYETTMNRIQKENPDRDYVAVGYGSEKAEDFLRKELPDVRIERLDSDAASKVGVLSRILEAFRKEEIDILVGTQMLAKGHDFPNVTLIVILEVDQLLSLPDFRAGEKTFQLMVQTAGRAGRAEFPGKVMVQSLKPSHPIVQCGLRQDFETFAKLELGFRKAHGFPPFSRLIQVEFKSKQKNILEDVSREVIKLFESWAVENQDLFKNVKIFGPSIPPLETIRLKHRRTLIMSSPQYDRVRTIALRLKQSLGKQRGDLEIKIDVDPMQLM